MNARSDFLEARRFGLGGSDISGLLGLSKYATPYDVWLSKQPDTDLSDGDDDEKPWLYWGSILEDVVAKEYSKRTGNKVQRVNSKLIHPEHHFAFANIDRAVINPDIRGNVRWIDGRLTTDRILECKTANGFAAADWGEIGTDEVPESYLCQTQWYLGITGAKYADLAVLIGGSDYRSYTIEADPELFASLIEEAARFWQLVQDGIAPDPQTVADAQKRWAKHQPGETVAASTDAANAIEELHRIAAQKKATEAREKELKLILFKEMQDAETITDMGAPVATWKTQDTNRLDAKALREDHPEIAAIYTKTSSSRVLRLKAQKG